MKKVNFIIIQAAVFFVISFIARDVFCSSYMYSSDINPGRDISCNIESNVRSLSDQLDQKNAEIEMLKNENNELRERQDIQTAGTNPGGFLSISLILMFSAITGVISVTIAKRRTRSLCHCNNRRIKLMKMNKAKCTQPS